MCFWHAEGKSRNNAIGQHGSMLEHKWLEPHLSQGGHFFASRLQVPDTADSWVSAAIESAKRVSKFAQPRSEAFQRRAIRADRSDTHGNAEAQLVFDYLPSGL